MTPIKRKRSYIKEERLAKVAASSSLSSLRKMPTLAPASTLPKEKLENIASMYWKEFLRPAGWIRFNPKLSDWGFVPVQYKHIGAKNVRRRGQRGVHFAEGWVDLYEMIRKFGCFDGTTDDGFLFLTSYKGPNLQKERVSRCNVDRDVKPVTASEKHNKKKKVVQEEKQQEPLIFSVMKGNPNTRKKLVSLIPEDVWHCNNPMPYKYLEKVLEDTRNNICIGEMMNEKKKGNNEKEICSIFAFRTSGFNQKDATVTLLWTQSNERRKGFSTQLIKFGIQFLTDDSLIMSGAAPVTKYSESLFESQSWDRVDGGHGFFAEIQKLRRTLEEKGRAFQIATDRMDGCWEVKIPRDGFVDQNVKCNQQWNKERCQQNEAAVVSVDVSPSLAATSTGVSRCVSVTPTNASSEENSDMSSYQAPSANNEESKQVKQNDYCSSFQTPAASVLSIPNSRPCTMIQYDTNGPHQKLLDLLRRSSDCIKGNYKEFCKWLIESEDINSIDDLKEAIMDDEYVRDDLQKGNGTVGLKGFKRKSFQRYISSYIIPK